MTEIESLCTESEGRFPEYLWQSSLSCTAPKELSLVIYSSVGITWNDVTMQDSTFSKQIKLWAFKWGCKTGWGVRTTKGFTTDYLYNEYPQIQFK